MRFKSLTIDPLGYWIPNHLSAVCNLGMLFVLVSKKRVESLNYGLTVSFVKVLTIFHGVLSR